MKRKQQQRGNNFNHSSNCFHEMSSSTKNSLPPPPSLFPWNQPWRHKHTYTQLCENPCFADLDSLFRNVSCIKHQWNICKPNWKLGEKSFCETSFEVGMDQLQVQKQNRKENMQLDYPTTEWWQERKTNKKTTLNLPHISLNVGQSSCLSFLPLFHSRVVFLCVFIPVLFLYALHDHPYIKLSFVETFPP